MAVRKLFLVTVDLLAVLLLSGAIFGGPALERLLRGEGRFSERCRPDESDGLCAPQEAALVLVFTAATTALSVAALPAGWLADACGPLIAALVAGALEVLGLSGAALALAFGGDTLLAVSLVAMAVGGFMLYVGSFSLPFLFPKRATLLCAALSCLFDGGAAVFPALELMTRAGLRFRTVFWAYAGSGMVLVALLLPAWCLNRDALRALSAGPTKEAQAQAAGTQSQDPEKGAPARETVAAQQGHERLQVPDHALGGDITSRPLLEQLCSPEFPALVVFAAVEIPKAYFYLSAVDLVTAEIAERAHGGLDLDQCMTLIYWMVPLVDKPWSVPLVEVLSHRIGIIGGLQLTSLLGWAYAGLQLVPSLGAQVAAAAAYGVYRALLFSFVMAFAAHTFGPRTMGRIMGLCQVASALVNLAQPLVMRQLLPDSGTPNVVVLVSVMAASAPMPAMWFCLQRWQRRRATRCLERKVSLEARDGARG